MKTKPYKLLEKLSPKFKEKVQKFLAEVNKTEAVIFLTETWRSDDRQKELIASGLSQVARSLHQDGLAIDIGFYGNELYP